MKVLSYLLAAALVLIVVGIAAYVGLARIADAWCVNEIVRRTPSPNGRREVVLFQRNCGATTDFATNLSVVRTGSDIGARGNLFIADSYDGRAALDTGFVIRLSVQWLSNDSVLVRYDPRAQVFLHKHRVRGISIAYDTIPPRGA